MGRRFSNKTISENHIFVEQKGVLELFSSALSVYTSIKLRAIEAK